MLSNEHKEIAKDVIQIFTSFGTYTVDSINEGSCDEFADYLNEQYARNSLGVHQMYSTLNFLSSNVTLNDDCMDCIYMKDCRKDVMESLGVPSDYFREYWKQAEAVDSRGIVPFHVWLFDGELHYDATCLDGVKNPLELPFFQFFTKDNKWIQQFLLHLKTQGN